MRRLFCVLMVVCLMIAPVLCAGVTKTAKSKDVKVMAREFVVMMNTGKFHDAVKLFDKTMSSSMTAKQLGQTWKALELQVGAFKKPVGIRAEKIQGYDAVFVKCEFEKALLDVKLVFDETKKIAGFFVVPSDSSGKYELLGNPSAKNKQLL